MILITDDNRYREGSSGNQFNDTQQQVIGWLLFSGGNQFNDAQKQMISWLLFNDPVTMSETAQDWVADHMAVCLQHYKIKVKGHKYIYTYWCSFVMRANRYMYFFIFTCNTW